MEFEFGFKFCFDVYNKFEFIALFLIFNFLFFYFFLLKIKKFKNLILEIFYSFPTLSQN